VVLVLMDEYFEPLAMYRAGRIAIEAALARPGSRARSGRDALAVLQFIEFGRKMWPASNEAP
jgi:hypothetical protein